MSELPSAAARIARGDDRAPTVRPAARSAIAGCAAVASQTVNELLLETRHRYLNLDAEWNLWAWVVLLLQIARTLCSAEARGVLHAGLLLIGVAVAAEVAGGLTTRLGGALGCTYDVNIAVEEASELAGWLLIATALAAAAFAAVAAAERR